MSRRHRLFLGGAEVKATVVGHSLALPSVIGKVLHRGGIIGPALTIEFMPMRSLFLVEEQTTCQEEVVIVEVDCAIPEDAD